MSAAGAALWEVGDRLDDAQASLHTEAMAADIMFVGLDMARLWQQLRRLGTGGVGYYRQNKFLHVDTGPPRFWEAATSRVQENLSADNARVFLRTDFDKASAQPPRRSKAEAKTDVDAPHSLVRLSAGCTRLSRCSCN
jgi:hypothetical protein